MDNILCTNKDKLVRFANDLFKINITACHLFHFNIFGHVVKLICEQIDREEEVGC